MTEAEGWIGGFYNPLKVKKVLVLIPLADLQTGLAVSTAFTNLGMEVTAADPVQDTNATVAALDMFDGELIFCGREAFLASIIEDIRKKHENTIVATFNPDVRYDIHDFEPLFPLFRRSSIFYTVGYGNVEAYRNEGINAFWLPEGLQAESYKLPETLVTTDRDKYTCDVCFIGGDRRRGLHEGRTEILDAIEQSPFKHRFWGCRGSEQVWDEEHNKAVACSSINIAHSGWSKLDRYMSSRAYKIMGAGGFVLANYHQAMEDWLPCRGNSKILETYTTPRECLEKIHYYLKNEPERQEIAQRGYEWVQTQTFTDRMRSVLEHVESGKYFFHHYSDIRDCRKSVDEMMKTRIRSRGSRNIVATISTLRCHSATKQLIATLQNSGWRGPITIFTIEEDSNAMKAAFKDQAHVDVVVLPEWYVNYQPREILNRDARYLKPMLINAFAYGDKVLFVDGADVTVHGELDEIFSKLSRASVILTPAEDKETPLPSGYAELFEIEGVTPFNAGVWAFRKSGESEEFFKLWKALCAWSLHIGHGDMCAMVMAANIWDKFEVMGREWNWLPSYGEPSMIDGRPFTPDGVLIRILHQAGRGILRR